MSANDETIRLILQLEGEKEVRSIAEQLEREKKILVDLLDLKARNPAGVNQADVNSAAASVINLNNQLEESQRSLAKLTGAGAGRGGGQGILGAAYAFQDFTSQISNGVVPALGAIQNNIPGILAGLGASAGLVGVISAASVAAGLLIKNWDSLAAAFKAGGVKSAAEEMEQLEKATGRTADQQDRLNRLKEREAVLKAIAEGKTPEQKKEEAAYLAFFQADPQTQGKIAGALAASGRGEQMTEAEAAKRPTLERIARNSPFEFERERARREIDAIQERINQVNIDRAGKILADAVKSGVEGAQARQTIGVLRPDIAARLRTEGPEAQSNRKFEEERAKERDKEDEAEAKERERAADEKAKAERKRADHEELVARESEEFARRGREDKDRDPQFLKPLTAAQLARTRKLIAERARDRQAGAIGQDLEDVGIHVDARRAAELAKGKQAQLAQVQAQALGQILFQDEQTQRQVAMWRSFQQLYQRRVQEFGVGALDR